MQWPEHVSLCRAGVGHGRGAVEVHGQLEGQLRSWWPSDQASTRTNPKLCTCTCLYIIL